MVSKLQYGFIFAIIGLFCIFMSYRQFEPGRMNLLEASGKVISITNKKGLRKITIEGHNKSYGFRSLGRNCEDLPLLESIVGENILVEYESKPRKPLFSDDYYYVFSMYSDGKPICSYGSAMKNSKSNSNDSFYVGIAMFIVSALFFIGYFREKSNNSFQG